MDDLVGPGTAIPAPFGRPFDQDVNAAMEIGGVDVGRDVLLQRLDFMQPAALFFAQVPAPVVPAPAQRSLTVVLFPGVPGSSQGRAPRILICGSLHLAGLVLAANG